MNERWSEKTEWMTEQRDDPRSKTEWMTAHRTGALLDILVDVTSARHTSLCGTIRMIEWPNRTSVWTTDPNYRLSSLRGMLVDVDVDPNQQNVGLLIDLLMWLSLSGLRAFTTRMIARPCNAWVILLELWATSCSICVSFFSPCVGVFVDCAVQVS